MRRWRICCSVEIGVLVGRVRGIVLPWTFLTNICIVFTSASEPVALEAMDETLEERRMLCGCCVLVMQVAVAIAGGSWRSWGVADTDWSRR